MKRRKLIVLAIALTALLLEALPIGINFRFDNSTARFSYFDPIVIGYTGYGAIMTALMTLILVLAAVTDLFLKKKQPSSAVSVVAAVGTIFSILPIFVKSYSLIGALITLMLAAAFVMSVIHVEE